MKVRPICSSHKWLVWNEQFCFPVDLWLQYIQEELGPLGQPENCSKIHWRAIKFLEGESVERFISKYTLLQTGHWVFHPPSWRLQAEGAARAFLLVLEQMVAPPMNPGFRWEAGVVVSATQENSCWFLFPPTAHFVSTAVCAAPPFLDRWWKKSSP